MKQYCRDHRCKVFAMIKPSIENTEKYKMSTLNKAAFDLKSNRYRTRTYKVMMGTNALGNRQGVASNRATPRNF